MKSTVLVFLLLTPILLLLACTAGDQEQQAEPDPVAAEPDNTSNNPSELEDHSEPVPENTLEGPVEYLELCYATSVNIPELSNGPQNVFDGDESTYWATMPGAGPDEGIMFTFENPVHISSIMVESGPEGPEFGSITGYRLFVNGTRLRHLRAMDEYEDVDLEALSVYIRIEETGDMEYEEQGIRNDGNLPVAIREVSILVADEDGNTAPLRVEPIRIVPGTVTASSSLEPVEAYNTDFLFDSRSSFGWADGNINSTGEGETLTFSFQNPTSVEKIKIWNGYQRSGTHFLHNERASELLFQNSSLYPLEDEMGSQVIILDTPFEGESFTIEFPEVYEGEVYRDLVISELRFFDGENWFGICTGGNEIRKQAVLEWAGNTAASEFIDRQIYTELVGDGVSGDGFQSLIIRSNGSFVIWKEIFVYDSVETVYFDGNWQIIDDSTIRIFGLFHRDGTYINGYYRPYSGADPVQNQETERETIFSDTLTFNSNSISFDSGLFIDFEF